MLAHDGRSRRSIAMDRRTGGRRLQRRKVECVTVVLLPSLGCRVLMTDVLSGYCGVGGASLATRLDAGKRHAVWWTDCRGGLYEKTRFSLMAETGFCAVVSQALDAPVVLCLRSPLPEVTTIKVSCCLVLPARWSDVPAASKPIRHCTDVNHSSPGKGRGCADPSLNSSSHAWGFSIPGFPEKFLRGSKASTESLLLKRLKYGLKIAEKKWGVKKKFTVNILILQINWVLFWMLFRVL